MSDPLRAEGLANTQMHTHARTHTSVIPSVLVGQNSYILYTNQPSNGRCFFLFGRKQLEIHRSPFGPMLKSLLKSPGPLILRINNVYYTPHEYSIYNPFVWKFNIIFWTVLPQTKHLGLKSWAKDTIIYFILLNQWYASLTLKRLQNLYEIVWTSTCNGDNIWK